MGAKFRSWWQIIVTILVVIIILVVVIALIIVEIRVYGTGFTGKTLWDWLQLLSAFAIPVVVGFGAVWFTTRQNHDREIAYLQHEHDHQITADNQNETALQAYIDKMSELLLHEKLRDSAEKEDEVRQIARVRTLMVLSKLDPTRKWIVLKFLFESGLIKNNNPIVDLSYANLKEADLYDLTLFHSNLEHSNLSNANLEKADLSGTNLIEANLTGADLTGANLTGADLTGANLTGTKFQGAKYNTKPIPKNDEHGKPVTDEQGNPVMMKPTQWPQGFDPKAAKANCVDC